MVQALVSVKALQFLLGEALIGGPLCGRESPPRLPHHPSHVLVAYAVQAARLRGILPAGHASHVHPAQMHHATSHNCCAVSNLSCVISNVDNCQKVFCSSVS